MRWQHPKDGTVIWKKRFAWFPKTIQNQTVWLESYYTQFVYGSHGWDDIIRVYKYHYLPESAEVSAWKLSQSPLAKAMEE